MHYDKVSLNAVMLISTVNDRTGGHDRKLNMVHSRYCIWILASLFRIRVPHIDSCFFDADPSLFLAQFCSSASHHHIKMDQTQHIHLFCCNSNSTFSYSFIRCFNIIWDCILLSRSTFFSSKPIGSTRTN